MERIRRIISLAAVTLFMVSCNISKDIQVKPEPLTYVKYETEIRFNRPNTYRVYFEDHHKILYSFISVTKPDSVGQKIIFYLKR
jgi:hypothetical protein